ncbi:trace amine-associated receptor 13c-like [Latimeria chalumnae]|uniref:trace amine-associated receptor 13c-like n=1 Tax=Latimeria chalumnae TaxID=7897 RepID=UPI0003C13647|nr:PREDICTED: trace amine-associated receptor 13c-like [Latimeria chalumnae]|eukprot:XP_006014096.1 PREDICTED: trace amine-associated receptor 13c-like [Latimeria chalumnae]
MNATSFESMNTVDFCFKHINGSCIKTARTTETTVLIYIALGLAVLITLSGNLVVIISISHFKQLHTPNNMLVQSLAIADFLLGLCVMPFSTIRSVETCWYFDDLICKFHSGMDLLLCTTSIFHLCFIAIDHYYAVCDPLRYPNKINVQVAWFFIAIARLAPASYTIGLIYTGANDEGMKEYVAAISCVGGCFLFFNKTWVLVDSMTFFIPCLIMVAIYARIFIVARRQVRMIQSMEDKFRAKEENSSKTSQHREQKAAKTLAIVMGVFLFCWVPYFIDTILDEYSSVSTPTIVFDAVNWLGYLNSAINPLIYGFFYPWFRKAFKIIFSGQIFTSNSSTIRLHNE